MFFFFSESRRGENSKEEEKLSLVDPLATDHNESENALNLNFFF